MLYFCESLLLQLRLPLLNYTDVLGVMDMSSVNNKTGCALKMTIIVQSAVKFFKGPLLY